MSLCRFPLLLFTLLIIGSCTPGDKKEDPDQMRAFQHLDHLLTLKNEVASAYYKDFASTDVYLPLVYYTQHGTYVVQPNAHILKITDHDTIGNFKSDIPVIKLPESYTDTIHFHFYSSYSDSDTTALYYKENILAFQSFELTQTFIPDIKDLQDWSIMVIHELFHGYQRAIPQHRAYFTGLDIPGGPDEFLAAYYGELAWYKESVYRENELLKEIWIHNVDPVENLRQYTALRSKRIERIRSEYEVDIREIEDHEILVEGHARYFESLCKRWLASHKAPDAMLSEQDKALITGMFDQYKVEEDKGLYDFYNDRYYYQLGYNISMILEKYLPEYKETLYREEQDFNRYLQILMETPNPSDSSSK